MPPRGGVEFRSDGELVVPFVEKEGELFTELEFPFLKEHIPGAMVVWKPLLIGEKKYTAELFRYGAVFRVLVKLYNGDRVVSGIQWVCSEPTKAEQGGTDQPATAVDSKGDGRKSEWSEESHGLKARLALSRWNVTNGSGVIATHLELKNVGGTLRTCLQN